MITFQYYRNILPTPDIYYLTTSTSTNTISYSVKL